MNHRFFATEAPHLTRRRLVNGLALGGAIAGLGLWRPPVWAQAGPALPTILSGTQFKLEIGTTPVNFTGNSRIATAVNGQVPAPILH